MSGQGYPDPGVSEGGQVRRRYFYPVGICLLAVTLLAEACLSAEAEGETKPDEKKPADQPSPAPTPAAAKKADLFDLPLEQVLSIPVLRQPVTTVTRSKSTVGHTAAAIFVITQEMIRRSGATTIPELLRMVPGANVARIDTNKWAVSMRGFNERFSNKLLVQVDGRSVYSPTFSGVFWDAVDYPFEDIERIEVIRGPGASVWGANAVNGVVNIITKSAKDTVGGIVSAGGGTEEQGFGELRYGAKADERLYYRLYAKGFNREQGFSKTGDPRDDWTGQSAGARFDWLPTKADTVTFQGGYLRSVAGAMETLPQASPPFVTTVSDNEITNAGNVLLRWTRQVDKDFSFSLQTYWDHFERKSEQFLDIRTDTADLDFTVSLRLGDRHKTVFGAGYRFTDNILGESPENKGFVLQFEDRHRDTHLFSAFAQDEISLIEDKLTLLVGSKFEHNNFTGIEVQPTVRCIWTPSARQSLWAAVSRAVRTPNLVNDGLLLKATPSFPPPLMGAPVFPRVTGNRNVESEVMWAYELGYRTQATEKLLLDGAMFVNDYSRVIAVEQGDLTAGTPPTFELPLNFNNPLEGQHYGAELALTWQARKHWQLRGAYSFLLSRLHVDGGNLPAAERNFLVQQAEAFAGAAPKHQFDLRSAWTLPHDVDFDLIGRFVSRLHGFRSGAPDVENSVDRYFSLDARTAWRPLKNLELELVGQNLLENHHPEYGTSFALRLPLVEIERSAYFRVLFRF